MYQKKFAECPMESELPYKLAQAYIPFQKLTEVYSPREALAKGTLFPELWMPYHK